MQGRQKVGKGLSPYEVSVHIVVKLSGILGRDILPSLHVEMTLCFDDWER